MRIKSITIIAVLLSFCIIDIAKAYDVVSSTIVSPGLRDLSGWNFKVDGPVKLDGTWVLYRNQLLCPKDFTAKSGQGKFEVIRQPGNSGNIMLKGCGTYRLQIKVGNISEKLSIYVHYIFSAYKLFINGKEICSAGKVGTTKESTLPVFVAQRKSFPLAGEEIDIIIQVANFHHTKGGLLSSLYLGTAGDINRMREKNLFMDFLFIGGFVCMGLYYFLFYLMKKKDTSPFYFSIICFCFAFRVFIGSEVYIMELFPAFDWALLLRIEYLNFALVSPLFNLFFAEFYSGLYSRKVKLFYIFLFIVFSLIVLFTPTAFFSQINNYYYALCMVFPFYACYILIKVFIKKKDPEPLIFLFGFTIATTCLLVDLYMNAAAIYIRDVSTAGMFIFFFIQGFLISRRYSKTYQLSEKLSAQLQIQVKKKQEELTEQSRRQKDFFINFAHETKTPLTLISNYLASYVREVKLNKKLQIVKQNIDKLTYDMVDLLDFEKLQKGHSLYTHERITDVTGMLESKLPLYFKAAREKEQLLYHTIQKDVFVKADPSAVSRIIDNLVENAFKYTNTCGTIKITLKIKEETILLIVDDNGPGIPEDQLKKIFKPYYQITHDKRNLQGIGLGLNIVNTIVNSLDGEIDVDSVPGTGTCFLIKLPLYRGKQASAPVPASSFHINSEPDGTENTEETTSYNNKKKNILIVEDNPQMRLFLKSELEKKYNTYTADNGESGLVKLDVIPLPDLIISDIMMDRMDGYDFYERLSQSETRKGIPFIFLSAKSSPEEKIKGLQKGAIDYISKPFDIEELEAKIASILHYTHNKKKVLLQRALQLMENEFGDEQTHSVLAIDMFIKKYSISDRQIEIILKLVKGYSYKKIAQQLNLSIRTVENHIRNTYKKCRINNRVELKNLLNLP